MMNRIAISEFQFHNGTINTTGVGIGGSVLSSFNSTTVQLIHTEINSQNFWVQMFQFHNGTINTCVKFVSLAIVNSVSIPQRYN